MLEINSLFRNLDLINLGRVSGIIEPDLNLQFQAAIPFILSIVIVTILIFSSFLYYRISMSRLHSDESPVGLALILFVIVNYFRNLTRDLLGDSFEKYTPFFLSIFIYIMISNFMGMLEFTPPTASITVTLSLGLMSWVGTQIIGIRYQKWNYLKHMFFSISYKNKENKKVTIPIIPNPIEILGKMTPLISISFRLWGNIFAGVLIVSLVYNLPLVILSGSVSNILEPTFDHPIVILASLIAPPLHLFFDLMTGTIQAFVFLILTMVYWTIAKNE